MNDFLVALEQTAVGTFIRESSSYLGFPTVLTLHTVGLCFIMGGTTILTARLFGVASGIPLKPLRRLFPFMWVGLVLTLLSGTGLVIAAATTRALNPILLVKLVLIVAAMPLTWALQKNVYSEKLEGPLPQNARWIAGTQMVLWLAVLVAGRLIAYSATILGDGY
jgi:hypothetical protein